MRSDARRGVVANGLELGDGYDGDAVLLMDEVRCFGVVGVASSVVACLEGGAGLLGGYAEGELSTIRDTEPVGTHSHFLITIEAPSTFIPASSSAQDILISSH